MRAGVIREPISIILFTNYIQNIDIADNIYGITPTGSVIFYSYFRYMRVKESIDSMLSEKYSEYSPNFVKYLRY